MRIEHFWIMCRINDPNYRTFKDLRSVQEFEEPSSEGNNLWNAENGFEGLKTNLPQTTSLEE